jgi:hypothetical protein
MQYIKLWVRPSKEEFYQQRNNRRQRLAAHLHAAGARPILEALLDVASGRDLDETLADFGRVAVSTYKMVGADALPIRRLQ